MPDLLLPEPETETELDETELDERSPTAQEERAYATVSPEDEPLADKGRDSLDRPRRHPMIVYAKVTPVPVDTQQVRDLKEELAIRNSGVAFMRNALLAALTLAVLTSVSMTTSVTLIHPVLGTVAFVAAVVFFYIGKSTVRSP